jgi:hypothetical protein
MSNSAVKPLIYLGQKSKALIITGTHSFQATTLCIHVDRILVYFLRLWYNRFPYRNTWPHIINELGSNFFSKNNPPVVDLVDV